MTTHKAVTIKQPHVAAIFAGLKRFETRSWSTKYRGPLLIHAGKVRDTSMALSPWPIEDLERWAGCIHGVVELVGCWQAEGIRRESHRGWGDFTPGRFAWELANPRIFKAPIPVRGQLGLWTYRGEIEGQGGPR